MNKQNEHIIKPNGHLYKFRLASTNDIGSSEFSEESNTIKSKYDLPRLNLYNLTAKPLDLNRILLKWDEILLADDSLIKFKIIYRKVFINLEDMATQTQGSEVFVDYKSTKASPKHNDTSTIKHEYELITNGLESNGKYEFELCGINLVGQALKCIQSLSITYMEDRKPEYDPNQIKLVKALSSTEINVTWTKATEEQINGKLLGYKLVYINNEFLRSSKLRRYLARDEAELNFYSDYYDIEFTNQPRYDESIVDVVIVEPEYTSIILNNLKPFKNYSVFVQLINQAGESDLGTLERNSVNTAQTFEATPSQPSRLEFSYIAYNFLNVTIFKPRDPNGVLKAYELWYENIPSKPHLTQTTKIIRQEIVTNLDADNQTLFISNLEPMSSYKFKVHNTVLFCT